MELMVSIILFMLILGFLYHALNVTQTSSDFFATQVKKSNDLHQIKEIFIEDFIHSSENVILEKKDENTLLKLQTSNSLHHPFYKHVTYLVSREKTLFRIESLNIFDQKNLNNDFFEKAYMDKIANEVDAFEVVNIQGSQKSFSIMLKLKDKMHIFSVLQY